MDEDSQGKPKYQEVIDYLQECIRKGELKPGQRAPSENELSRQFQISRLTARHALSEMVNAGVLERQRGSGTYLRERHLRIGVCMTYVNTYIFPDILKGIDEKLRQHQMNLILTNSNNELEKEYQVLSSLLELNPDGLIWEPAQSALREPDDKMLQMVRDSRIPTVLLHSPLPNCGLAQVLTDDSAGMDILARHLYQFGHRRFAGLFCRDLIQGTRRHDGLLKALEQMDLAIEPEHLLWLDYHEVISGFEQKIMPWLERLYTDQVTALCCYNDYFAMRCLPLLRQAGFQVPENLSLVGFDAIERLSLKHDSSFGSLAGTGDWHPASSVPWLTTVSHPCAQLGRLAVDLLLDQLSGRIQDQHPVIEMPTELVIGKSSGPAPAAR